MKTLFSLLLLLLTLSIATSEIVRVPLKSTQNEINKRLGEDGYFVGMFSVDPDEGGMYRMILSTSDSTFWVFEKEILETLVLPDFNGKYRGSYGADPDFHHRFEYLEGPFLVRENDAYGGQEMMIEGFVFNDPYQHFTSQVGEYTFKGRLIEKTVKIGSNELQHIAVGLAKEFTSTKWSYLTWMMPSYFKPKYELRHDGVFGLSRHKSPLDDDDETPPTPAFMKLLDQRSCDLPQISFYFQKTPRGGGDGEVVFCGIDRDRVVGGINFEPPFDANSGWSVRLDAVFLGMIGDDNRLPLSEDLHFLAQLDTGTSVIKAPKEALNGMMGRIEAKFAKDLDRYVIMDCTAETRAELPQLRFRVDREVYVMNGEDYFLPPIRHHLNHMVCPSAVVPNTEPNWVLGIPFHKSVYVVYEYGLAVDRVGFGRLREEASPRHQQQHQEGGARRRGGRGRGGGGV